MRMQPQGYLFCYACTPKYTHKYPFLYRNTSADCTAWFLSAAFRSIPIVSRLDYHYPVYSKYDNVTCGSGDVSWNTVAGSPFAEEASVGSWEELPTLLDRLRGMSQEDINKLQVNEWIIPIYVGTPRHENIFFCMYVPFLNHG